MRWHGWIAAASVCLALAACESSSTRAARVGSSNPPGTLSFAVVSGSAVCSEGDFSSGSSESHPSTRLWSALSERLTFPQLRFDAAAPELLLICGDLTQEKKTSSAGVQVEAILDRLELPCFAAASPRDLSTARGLQTFNQRFGGLVYSFDRSGAHFIALCSATPGESRPSFSPLQLKWLKDDLERNDDRQPVFVFVHHALASADLAPSQILELRAAFDGHDIAAVFSGEDGPSGASRVSGIDCIRSGNEASDRGYVQVSIAAGKLRIARCSLDPNREPRLLLEKTLRYRPRAPMSIEEPVHGAPAREKDLAVVVRSPSKPSSLLLDGRAQSANWRERDGAWHASVPLDGVAGGAHQLAVGCDDDGAARLQTCDFLAPSREVQLLWRRTFEGALQGTPSLRGSRIAVASTAGELALLEASSGEMLWSAKSAAVIGSPWLGDDGTVVVANLEGWVEAYDEHGARRWRFQLGKPCIDAITCDGELVYARDIEGKIFAIELAGGRERRSFDAAAAVVDATSPASAAERIARVSETGLVTLLDAASGATLWSWRATDGSFVSAAPVLGPDGTVWIAALDGTLSAIRAR